MLSHELIAQYAVLIVFLNVFTSSLGLPIPATPTLAITGASTALATDGIFPAAVLMAALIAAAVIGGLLADYVWFSGSKRFGQRALTGVGRLLMPRLDHVKKLERYVGSREVHMLVFARFVPGLSFLSVLLCGTRNVRLRSFIAHDSAGIGLWAATALTAGLLAGPQLERWWGPGQASMLYG